MDAFLVGTVLYAIVTALLLCPPLWLFGARATLVGLAAVEGAFFLARRAERRRRRLAPASPPPSEPVPEAVLHHLLDLADEGVLDFEGFLRGWFFGAPLGKISSLDIERLAAYGFMYRRLEELPPEGRAFVTDARKRMEKILGRVFPPPRSGQRPRRFNAHLWRPVKTLYQPLLVVLQTEILALLSGAVLGAWGFERRQEGCLEYWVKRADAVGWNQDADEADPVVFFHGVGMGLVLYIPFLRTLLATARSDGRPRDVVVMDMRWVSMRLTNHVPTVDEVADDFQRALTRTYGAARGVQLVGHSYGTFCCARVVQKFPELVSSVCLVDPVCFLLIMPDILSNFLVNPPRSPWQHGIAAYARDLIRIVFCSREESISHAFCRDFYWHQYTLWFDQLPRRSTVVLSAEDEIVPSAALRRYLTHPLYRRQIRTIWWPHFDHAAFLGCQASVQQVADAIMGA